MLPWGGGIWRCIHTKWDKRQGNEEERQKRLDETVSAFALFFWEITIETFHHWGLLHIFKTLLIGRADTIQCSTNSKNTINSTEKVSQSRPRGQLHRNACGLAARPRKHHNSFRPDHPSFNQSIHPSTNKSISHSKEAAQLAQLRVRLHVVGEPCLLVLSVQLDPLAHRGGLYRKCVYVCVCAKE